MLKPIREAVQFSIDYYQCLNEQAEITSDLPAFASDHEKLLHMYQAMLRTRIFDQKAIALQRTGRLGTYPSSQGQEAIAVAIGSALTADDVFCPYYREMGTHLMRGGSMEEIMLFWGGDERGSDYAGCRQDLPQCVPIASQCLHAVGVANAMKLRKEKRCALVTIGEGGTSEGDFYEALNVAGAWKLPVIFVINNNQWAISVPREAQTSTETIVQKGIAGGLPCYQVDGNDVIAMTGLLEELAERARRGEGAAVVEAITYRLGDHTTADDARRYRDQAEVDAAAAKEPLIRMRQYLTGLGVLDEAKDQAMQQEIHEQVETAVANYESTPPQPVEAIFDSLYAELPEAYADQRQELMAYAAAGEKA